MMHGLAMQKVAGSQAIAVMQKEPDCSSGVAIKNGNKERVSTQSRRDEEDGRRALTSKSVASLPKSLPHLDAGHHAANTSAGLGATRRSVDAAADGLQQSRRVRDNNNSVFRALTLRQTKDLMSDVVSSKVSDRVSHPLSYELFSDTFSYFLTRCYHCCRSRHWTCRGKWTHMRNHLALCARPCSIT
jgi:hypothetical protein